MCIRDRHIPGHGLSKVDSHKQQPIVNKNISYLKKNDFLAFHKKKSYLAMTAHIIYNKIDKTKKVISNVLIILFIAMILILAYIIL